MTITVVTVEALKKFLGLNLQLLNCDYNCDGHVFISFVYLQFTLFSFNKKSTNGSMPAIKVEVCLYY